jgi:hypothetical protein
MAKYIDGRDDAYDKRTITAHFLTVLFVFSPYLQGFFAAYY